VSILLNILKHGGTKSVAEICPHITHPGQDLTEENKVIVKRTKRSFFDEKIQEIALKNKRLWYLINWVKKYKLLATKAIKFNRHPYIKLDNLW